MTDRHVGPRGTDVGRHGERGEHEDAGGERQAGPAQPPPHDRARRDVVDARLCAGGLSGRHHASIGCGVATVDRESPASRSGTTKSGNSSHASWCRNEKPLGVRRNWAHAIRTSSASISMDTVRPTSTPPPSSTWFQVSPKSLRSSWALAVKPARTLSQGSVTPPSKDRSSTTGRVTSRTVRSPSTLHRPGPAGWTARLRYVITGKGS